MPEDLRLQRCGERGAWWHWCRGLCSGERLPELPGDRNYSTQTVQVFGFALLAYCRWLAAEGLDTESVDTDTSRHGQPIGL